jgi:hypothetical protein
LVDAQYARRQAANGIELRFNRSDFGRSFSDSLHGLARCLRALPRSSSHLPSLPECALPPGATFLDLRPGRLVAIVEKEAFMSEFSGRFVATT